MEKSDLLWLGSALGVAALYFFLKKPTPEKVIEEMDSNAGFYAPYYSNVPGFPDLTSLFAGNNSGFNSVINVNANFDPYSGITRNYIPMFGFVGAVGVGEI